MYYKSIFLFIIIKYSANRFVFHYQGQIASISTTCDDHMGVIVNTCENFVSNENLRFKECDHYIY